MLKKLIDRSVQVLPESGLSEKLSKNRPLNIKLGCDPTAPDLHLGHAIVLEKLKDFQDAGHHVIFLIGDFTALIGDPSGTSKTRPSLTVEEIKQNAATYFKQVGKILDLEKTEIRYNSRWLSTFDLASWLKLSSKITLTRIIEREDFANRLQNKQSIRLHELFYPIMQGYDSVALKTDVELGGTDQTFNLLMGRYVQEIYKQESQVIMTLPLLEGLDGVHKMSKSLGNHIGLFQDPVQVFGKIMSITDALMWRYYLLLLHLSSSQIVIMQEKVRDGRLHPMELKKELATKIITKYWSEQEAEQGRQTFEALFQKHDYSKAQEINLTALLQQDVWIVDLLRKIGSIKTSSQARRLIESNAVRLNDTVIDNFKASVRLHSGMIIKVGKHRIYRIA